MKKGFTLAEVLITLAIIGVVAALTIPAVVHKYQQQVLYTQFMKARADLNDALQLATAEKGFAKDWFAKDLYNLQESWEFCYPIFKQYMSIQKECNYADLSCFASEYKEINGNKYSGLVSILYNQYSAILNNGMSVSIYMLGTTTGPTCGFYVDTNGKKGPNVYGRDLFDFTINRDFNIVEPSGYRYFDGRQWIKRTDLDKCKTRGMYCGGYLLENGKMDY